MGIVYSVSRDSCHGECPLISCQAREDDRDLQLLMAVTDLLASCAEGENLFIESVCQTIYKVHVLMRDEKEGRKKQARSNKQHKAKHVYNVHVYIFLGKTDSILC